MKQSIVPARRRTRTSRSWSRRLSRFTRSFPRLLRTSYWTRSRTPTLWASLFGTRRRKADGTALPSRRDRGSRKLATCRTEALEPRQLLTSSFTPGDLVIYRIGTGATALDGSATAVFLDEYTPTGTLVQSIAMPTAHSGPNLDLTASGSASSEGLMTRSVDGKYIIVPGYDAALGTVNVANTAATSNPRVIGRVDIGGAIDTSTGLTDFTGGNIRTAVSTNGTDLWVSGLNLGAAYTTLGSTGTNFTTLNSTIVNLRQLLIAGDQLYVSSGAGAVRLATIGTGLPTTSGQAITNLSGLPTSAYSPYGFFFADLSTSVSGLDTLYVIDDGAGGGVRKYTFDGTTWAQTGFDAVGAGIAGGRGLTGIQQTDGSVTLFLTDSLISNNALQTVTDTSGYNGTMNGIVTSLASAGTDKVFRGVALAPDDGIAAIGGLGDVVNYITSHPAVVIGGAATFADASNFKGSSLTVTLTLGGTSSDQLSVNNVGTAAGQIGVSGNTITYGGVTIGTIDGTLNGVNGAALKINFNPVTDGDVLSAAVQALLDQVTFSSTDGGGDRTVQFKVTQNDGQFSTATQTVHAIANSAPLFTSSSTAAIDENTTAVLTLMASDADSDPVSYSISGGDDQGNFAISGMANDQLVFSLAPDYENPTDADHDNVYLVSVTANDGHGGLTVQNITVTVNPVNDNTPVGVNDAISVAEGDTATTLDPSGSSLLANDTDDDLPNDALSVTQVNGSAGNVGVATATSHGTVTASSDGTFSYTHDGSENFTDSFTYQVSDAEGHTNTATVNITITPVNDNAPVFTAGASQTFIIPENSGDGTMVGAAAATDADLPGDALTYSIIGGDPNNGFAIDANGKITIANSSVLDLDFDNGDTVAVLTVQVTDGVNPVTQQVTVKVSDVDEFDVTAPVDTDATPNQVAENSPINSPVGITAFAQDADGTNNTVTYSLTDDAGGKFQIDSSTGVVTVTGNAPDYEAGASHNITVRADSSDGSFATQSFTIAVLDVDEFDVTTPVDTDSAPNQVAENSPVDTTVGITALATDVDGTNNTVTYSLTNNAGGLFKIDPVSGVVSVAVANLDFETASSHSVRVRTDSSDGSAAEEDFTIAVTDVNEPASIGGVASGSVTEDGTLTDGNLLTVSDPDAGESIFQSVPALAGNYGNFTFDENTGAWTYTLSNASVLVQALAAGQIVSDNLTVYSFDGSASQEISVSITGENDIPAFGGGTSGDVTEDSVFSANGLLTIVDADAGQSSFIAASGTTTYGSFTLAADGTWTYTLNNSDPAVQALNSGDMLSDGFLATSFDGSASQPVSITIHGADEAPTVTTINGTSDANTLTIDFDNGTYSLDGGPAISLVGLQTLNFNGGQGFDSLMILGGGGSQVYTYGDSDADGFSGSVTVNGLTINYTGLEPIANTGSPTDVEFILTGGADSATLKSLGGGMYRLQGATFEQTDFSVAGLSSLTIRGSGDSDSLTVDDAISVPTITLDFETINLNADLNAATIAGGANTTTVNVAGNAQIQDAVALATTGATINLAAGVYLQDVILNKDGLRLIGAGASATTVSGAIGGSGSTISIGGVNQEIAGLTITRDGNNTTDWNDPALNTAGISIQGLTLSGTVIHDNIITGNRTGIDINNSNGHVIRNNEITDNRTGLIFRNQTDSLTVVENDITNNWTVGVLFLDASGGTNSPVQQALNCTFTNNNISGNWYGGIVDRQSGGSLPAPGTNLKNFSGNWFGTASPAITTANSAEPGYAAQIPVEFGGTATNPGGAPDIAGPASANFDITPLLTSGVDTNVQTTPGRGTFGFQGDYSTVEVTAAGAETGAVGRIQEGINLASPDGTVKILGGVYSGDVNATTSSVVLSPGASPAKVTINGNLTLDSNDTLAIEIDGLSATTDYDNLIVNGTVALGGAALSLSGSYVPTFGDSFTIIDNDGAVDGNGSFTSQAEGSSILLNGIPLKVSYIGGDGNSVTLTDVVPTNVWVNDTWIITNDIGPAGLSVGDTVMSNTGASDSAVSGLSFGYDAYSTISSALATVANLGTIHVLAGTYNEALNIGKDVHLLGQDDGVVTVDAGGGLTGLNVQGGFTVEIAGIHLQNFSSTGVVVNPSADVNLHDATIDAMHVPVNGLVGIRVDHGTLHMSSTLVIGAIIFGVDVGGGLAVISDSEITGTGGTAAEVNVSEGVAQIETSKLNGGQRGFLVSGTGSGSVHHSDLTDNVRAVENASGTVLDTSTNWWGVAGETAVQALTLGIVDFTPYLEFGADGSGIRGFQGDFSHLHVTALRRKPAVDACRKESTKLPPAV